MTDDDDSDEAHFLRRVLEPPQLRDPLARAYLRERLFRNKTRRGKDGDPPAAAPAPVEPRSGGGGLSGGAAAVMVFDELPA